MKKSINLILILACIISGIFYINQRHYKTEYVFNENVINEITIENEDELIIENYNKDSENEDTVSTTNDEIDLSVENNNLININTADEETLKTLPQIGDSLAKNIIEYREANGGFKDISEIKNVNMIGDKTFEKIKDLITI